MIWKVRNRPILFDRPLLMGILNLTPDSFSDGGKFTALENAVHEACRMIAEGADLLDLGGESTRPGAFEVSAKEELTRILPVLKSLRKKTGVPLSIDTTKPEVARVCLEEGADIINDVSGLKGSGPEMATAVRDFGAGLILMHRRGTPQTMQTLTHYQDVVKEVMEELRESIETALAAGLREDQLVIDPGLGFAKTAEQNLEILKHLEKFHSLKFPLLLGPSRKSFIGKITGREIGEREFGTAAVVALAVTKGVQILRVHDVKSMRDAVRMAHAISGECYVRSF